MREIKFRAWDGRQMFNVDVLAISPCTWACPDSGRRGVSLAYQPSIKVMQYTGLRDKNGREVYEGDIVKCTDGADEVNELNPDTGIGVVEWLEEFAIWNVAKIENSLGDLIFNGYVEVIGNVWEDGDLLNDREGAKSDRVY